METLYLKNWTALEKWIDGHSKRGNYIFRGQSNCSWSLRTSLARYFLQHPSTVKPNQWRKRELKMYRIFRERLLAICPGMYDDWRPMDILSLMQHHGAPTRLLDFSMSAAVAAYFALKDARGDSAIWVIDTDSLGGKKNGKDPLYAGPRHNPQYEMAIKHDGTSVFVCEPHLRLSAQNGCFLVPGKISKPDLVKDLHATKVTLSEEMIFDALVGLKGRRIDHEFLYPNLDKLAEDAKQFAVNGSAELPD